MGSESVEQPIKIAVVGRSGAGKTTLAAALLESGSSGQTDFLIESVDNDTASRLAGVVESLEKDEPTPPTLDGQRDLSLVLRRGQLQPVLFQFSDYPGEDCVNVGNLINEKVGEAGGVLLLMNPVSEGAEYQDKTERLTLMKKIVDGLHRHETVKFLALVTTACDLYEGMDDDARRRFDGYYAQVLAYVKNKTRFGASVKEFRISSFAVGAQPGCKFSQTSAYVPVKWLVEALEALKKETVVAVSRPTPWGWRMVVLTLAMIAIAVLAAVAWMLCSRRTPIPTPGQDLTAQQFIDGELASARDSIEAVDRLDGFYAEHCDAQDIRDAINVVHGQLGREFKKHCRFRNDFQQLKELVARVRKSKALSTSCWFTFATNFWDHGGFPEKDGCSSFPQRYVITRIDARIEYQAFPKMFRNVTFKLTSSNVISNVAKDWKGVQSIVKESNRQWLTIWKGEESLEGNPWNPPRLQVEIRDRNWGNDLFYNLVTPISVPFSHGQSIPLQDGAYIEQWVEQNTKRKTGDANPKVGLRIFVSGKGDDLNDLLPENETLEL